MNTLQIQDAFEPYYAGRKTPVQRTSLQRKKPILEPVERETADRGSQDRPVPTPDAH